MKRYIQPRLSVLPGAADVRIFGERQVSMRVNLDRTRLAGYKLTVQDVEDAIRAPERRDPGRPHRVAVARVHRASPRPTCSTPEQFDNIIVANVGGYPVRIRDVGTAEIGAVDERTVSRFNGKPSLNIGVIKQAVANPLDLSNGRARRGQEDQRRRPAAGHEADRRLRHVGVHRPLDHQRCSRRSARPSCWSCW